LLIVVFLFYILQAINLIAVIRPTINEQGYLDLIKMKSIIPPNSIIAVYDYGIRYWVEYVVEANVTHGNINQLPPDLWESYSHVLGLFPKEHAPPASARTIFTGKVYVLVELQQKH